MRDLAGYRSIFSGEEFDKGIEAALNTAKWMAHIKLQSSPINMVDLDELLSPMITYTIEYYRNGYECDDHHIPRPIEVSVLSLNESYMMQFYPVDGITVYRYYNVIEKTFTAWKKMESYLEADASEVVCVDRPTLVFRSGGDEIKSAPGTLYQE